MDENLIDIAAHSFFFALSGALMPGPMLAVTVCLVPRKGFWSGPLIVFGHIILEFLLVIACVWGLITFVEGTVLVAFVGVAGGLMMIWMGASMFKNSKHLTLLTDIDKHCSPQGQKESVTSTPPHNEPGSVAEIETKALRWHPLQALTQSLGEKCGLIRKRHAKVYDNCIAAGMLTTVGNPYWFVWWGGIGLALMSKSMGKTYLPLTAFFVGHILADLAWYSFIALTLTMGRQLISDRMYRATVKVCAVFVAFLGTTFLAYGYQQFWLK